MREPLSGHVVVCGLEGLSARTVEELLRMGEQVVVLAGAADARFRTPVERAGVRIIEGAPQSDEALREAGVPGARAIVFTTVDDVGNVHAALVARSLDPRIHIVVRVFDEDFGERLADLLPGAVALSASALAVPGFVSAVVGEDDAIFVDLLGRRLAVRHADAGEPGVLAQLGDDRADPVTLFPAPGTDQLSLVDTGPSPTHDEGAAAGRVPLRARIRRPPPLDPRFRTLAVLIGLLTGLSTLVFAFLGGVNPVDAVYNAVKAFFGGVDESVVRTPELRIFAIFLTLLGAAALATLYALIADAVLSSRLASILGTRVPQARDHIIVAGLGTIGFRIADALRRRGYVVLAAERQSESRFVAAARKLRIPVLTADARDPETLRSLHIDRAACLVAATDDDVVNMTTALHARTLRPDLRIVVRLFEPGLAERLDRVLGDNHSRSVSALAAPAFAAAAIGREAIATIPFGPRRVMVVARLVIDEHSTADGSTVADELHAAAATKDAGARALALVDGASVTWTPHGDDMLRAGQELVVVANRQGLANLVTRTEVHRPT